MRLRGLIVLNHARRPAGTVAVKYVIKIAIPVKFIIPRRIVTRDIAITDCMQNSAAQRRNSHEITGCVREVHGCFLHELDIALVFTPPNKHAFLYVLRCITMSAGSTERIPVYIILREWRIIETSFFFIRCALPCGTSAHTVKRNSLRISRLFGYFRAEKLARSHTKRISTSFF